MTGPRARYTYGWLGWVTATVVLETVALIRRRNHKDTLTAHTRYVLGIDPKRRYHLLGRIVYAVAALWTIYHISIAPAAEPRQLSKTGDET